MEGGPSARDASVLRCLARFCAAQGAPVLLVPEVVEAFVVGGLGGREPSTKGTYRSALRSLAGQGRPALAVGFPGSGAPAPYAPGERAELLSVASAQGSAGRRSSALVFLALGIGAGLRPAEMVAAATEDLTTRRGRVSVRVARDGRVVPVSDPYGEILAEQARRAGPGHLFRPGRGARPSKNLVNGFAEKLTADPAAPRFCAGRARSSFICGHLAAGTALSELLFISGIAEAGSLLRYARLVPGAPSSKAELRRRSQPC